MMYKIALTLLDGVGNKIGKALYEYCGSAKEVFKLRKRDLMSVSDIGEIVSKKILKSDVLKRAEDEMKFIERYNISPLFYTDDDYPQRLRHCNDSPILLFKIGNADVNTTKILSIVGTRKSTAYGNEMTKQIIEGFIDDNVLIVSGLAYGIDTQAHKVALDSGLQTLAVLGHGLDRIYPFQNKYLANKMLEQGGLITEFLSRTNPDAINFPSRNRIVAGMADAVVVIEAATKGGALITAEIANSYNRDVFAVPGRTNDEFSLGCNELIRKNKAALVQSAEDIKYILNWNSEKKEKKIIQSDLFISLTEKEKTVFDVINNKPGIYIDFLCSECRMPFSAVSLALLQLEVKGFITSLPGTCYKSCRNV